MELEIVKIQNVEKYYVTIKNEFTHSYKVIIKKLGISKDEYFKILNKNGVIYDYNYKGKKISCFNNEQDAQNAVDELIGFITMKKLMG